jgi:hypothetical protein
MFRWCRAACITAIRFVPRIHTASCKSPMLSLRNVSVLSGRVFIIAHKARISGALDRPVAMAGTLRQPFSSVGSRAEDGDVFFPKPRQGIRSASSSSAPPMSSSGSYRTPPSSKSSSGSNRTPQWAGGSRPHQCQRVVALHTVNTIRCRAHQFQEVCHCYHYRNQPVGL